MTSLWYSRPAEKWNEALPIGNGKLGAMFFGGVGNEKIFLNEDSLWSGSICATPSTDSCGNSNFHDDSNAEIFRQVQKLAWEKKYAEAEKLAAEKLCTSFTEAYLPAGVLSISSSCNELSCESNKDFYIRSLDMEKALFSVSCKENGIKVFSHRAFASFSENIISGEIKTDKSQNFVFSISSELRGECHVARDFDFPPDLANMLIFTGICPTHVRPDYVQSDNPVIYDDNAPGIPFSIAVSVISDGQVTTAIDGIHIENATSVEYTLTIITCFEKDFPPRNSGIYHFQKIVQKLFHGINRDFETLFFQHLKVYQPLFQRCKLRLSTSGERKKLHDEFLCDFSDISTDKRLELASINDVDLIRLLFDYGRYLLLSSSNKDSRCATLQGIWTKDIRSPWSSNYTLNINTQMNYWPAFTANLMECAESAIQFVKSLTISGKIQAEKLYGVQGSAVHHNSDLWYAANPVGEGQKDCCCYGFWPFGGAWLSKILFEYFEFTGNKEFLEKTALPTLKEYAVFFLSLLKKDENGFFIFCPATSPENTFVYKNEILSISRTTTMAMEIIYDVLTMTLKSLSFLYDFNLEDKVESDIYDNNVLFHKINEILPYLWKPGITSNNTIMEWYDDVQEVDIHHRHLSNLYGLYPGERLSVLSQTDEKWNKVCKNTLERRGDDGTGWSLAWKINLWARLRDGQKVDDLLKKQLTFVAPTQVNHFAGGGTYPNFFCAHPPFQIDGNFGATAGIIEGIVQSSIDFSNSMPLVNIVILPALPSRWAAGSLSGVCVKGGLVANIVWDRHLVSLQLKKSVFSEFLAVDCNIIFNNQLIEVDDVDNFSMQWQL